MAIKVETKTTKVDDIDGSKAEATVKFALDGKWYEIDLSKKHNAQIRRILKPYIDAGRKVKRTYRSRKSKTVASKDTAE